MNVDNELKEYALLTLNTTQAIFSWVRSLVNFNANVFGGFRDRLINFATVEGRRYEQQQLDQFDHWINVANDPNQPGVPLVNPVPANVNRLSYQITRQWLLNNARLDGERANVFVALRNYYSNWTEAGARLYSFIGDAVLRPTREVSLARDAFIQLAQANREFDERLDEAMRRMKRELDEVSSKTWDEVKKRLESTLIKELNELNAPNRAAPALGNGIDLQMNETIDTQVRRRLNVALLNCYKAVANQDLPETRLIIERDLRRQTENEQLAKCREEGKAAAKFRDRMRQLLATRRLTDEADLAAVGDIGATSMAALGNGVPNAGAAAANNNGMERKQQQPRLRVIEEVDEEAEQVEEDVPMPSLDEANSELSWASMTTFVETLVRKYAVLKRTHELMLERQGSNLVRQVAKSILASNKDIHSRKAQRDFERLDQLLVQGFGTANYQDTVNLRLRTYGEKRLAVWPLKRLRSPMGVPRAYGAIMQFATQMAGASNTPLDRLLVRIFPDIQTGSSLWRLVMARVEDEFGVTDEANKTRQRQLAELEQQYELVEDEYKRISSKLKPRAAEDQLAAKMGNLGPRNPTPEKQQMEAAAKASQQQLDQLNAEREQIVSQMRALRHELTRPPVVTTGARHGRGRSGATLTQDDAAEELEATILKLLPEQREAARKDQAEERKLQIQVGLDQLRRLNACDSLDDLEAYALALFMPTASTVLQQMHQYVISMSTSFTDVPLHELMFADVVSLRFAALCATQLLLNEQERVAKSDHRIDRYRYNVLVSNHNTNADQFVNHLRRVHEYEWVVK